MNDERDIKNSQGTMSASSGEVIAEEEEPAASDRVITQRPSYDELGEESFHSLGHQRLKVHIKSFNFS